MSDESDLLSTITSLLGSVNEKEEQKNTNEDSLDLDMVMKLGSMIGEFNQDDERSRLLHDLKPFVSDEKKEKIDQAIKILKIAKIAKKTGALDKLL